MADVAELIRSERLGLIGFLETLPEADWATPSLCLGWTVRDVAVHLASVSAIRPAEMPGWVVRGRFGPDGLNAALLRHWWGRSREEILDQLRVNAVEGRKPPGLPLPVELTDAVCHAIDIRRPLGRSGSVSAEAFAVVADLCAGLRWPVTTIFAGNARKLIHGLRLVADDVGWSRGQGPEVHGRSDVVLMLLTGRSVEAAEFTGPGAAALALRLPRRG